ncbi:M20 family metallopeptidase [Geomicrobium sp. JCM 19039]|uniref:M20 family metallopeptidase n=1 Tax=Geomicrobium sp. JCM 19039 TaxID=1460636 RepID=UPI00045F24E4|nr:M20 family metallopeptidase [Geomicrobium sp. JCM 19039]GAK11493.1 acetylornithine deacetylase [Geomicrobium sp. JCM 19039]
MTHEAILLTQKLVQIPSENPAGSEKDCATYVERWLREIEDVDVSVQHVEEGRTNVIAKRTGSDPSLRPLVILAHMDTVPVEGKWTFDPFAGEIANGKLYGRGACDMKSGLAAAMTALKQCTTQTNRRDLYVIATVDEEGPFMKGACALIDEGLIPKDVELIATEPTSLNLSTVHKGTIWYEINILGKSSHCGNAQLGIDAAHAAAESIVRLKKNVGALSYHHDIFGKPSLSVGTIHGGDKTNMVAGSVRLELDFRLVPPMSAEEADKLVHQSVSEGCKVVGAGYSAEHYGYARPPIESNKEADVIGRLQTAYKRTLGSQMKEAGFPAYTDVSMIGLKTGMRDLIVFGPGNLEQAHAIDEYVEVDQIESCTEVLSSLMQV